MLNKVCNQDGSGTLDFDELEDVLSILLEMECVKHKDSRISARKVFQVINKNTFREQ